MRDTVYATFGDLEEAKQAIGAMLDYGANPADISLIVNREDSLGVEDMTARAAFEEAKSGISTTTRDDAMAGAAKGAGIGFGVGALAAIAVLLVPGFGLVGGGGALATAILGTAGTTAAGAIAGGVTGYLKDQGMPEEILEHYANAYTAGDTIVSVSTPSNHLNEREARQILAKYGHTRVDVWPVRPEPIMHDESRVSLY